MSSITFQKSGRSDLEFEHGRVVPYSPEEIEIDQLSLLTESNTPIVVDYGNNLKLVKMQFTDLTKDMYNGTVNGLKTWFNSSQINWKANNFTMIDEFGATYTVRLWQDKWAMAASENGRYSIELTLLIEA